MVKPPRVFLLPAYKCERGGVSEVHCENDLADCRSTDKWRTASPRHDAATIVTGLDRASQRATSRRRSKLFPSDCGSVRALRAVMRATALRLVNGEARRRYEAVGGL
jgi:hypothetical protein